MKTEILKLEAGGAEGVLSTAAEVLRRDGVIVYPTDTFYGLGAGCYSRVAIRRIYRLKGRGFHKPLLVIISSREMLNEITVERPAVVEELINTFWPGPLTLVLPASPRLPRELLGGSGSIGVRLPEYPEVRELVRRAGFPVTATSANSAGGENIQRIERAVEHFSGRVDLILDGGETKGGIPSTVLECTSSTPKILRAGAVSALRLKPYLESPS